MDQVESITFTQSSSGSGSSRGSSQVNCKGTQVRDVRAMAWDWYSPCTSPFTGKCEIVTCMDSKEVISSWAPGSMLMADSDSDSIAHEREKPGRCSGLNALSPLGAVTLTTGSALGISDGTLHAEAGVTWSFSATSNILRSTRSPL